MRHLFLTLLCCCVLLATAWTQNDCYDNLLKKGIDLYNTENYKQAMIKWQGALECPDITVEQEKTLNNWISKANNPPPPCYETLLNEGITAYNARNYEPAKTKWQSALNCSNLTSAQQETLKNWLKKANNPPAAEPEMVFVQGGTFQMGSNDYDSEKPIHSVTLNGFYIGKYEITQKQWRDVMGSDLPELIFKGCDDCPVESVSWNDVQEFLQKLNAKTGKKYRLPTEAEWEFAARGGIQSKGYKYSGSNTLDNVAWNTSNSSNKTHTVGTKQANELGVFDMSGNVWEWCSDWYSEKYYRKSPNTNPTGASSGDYRVIRGGSWGNHVLNFRVAFRNYFSPAFRSYFVGFRVARYD